VQCTSNNFRKEFIDSHNEMIFACMEAGKQPYQNIISMPILKLTAYLKWKAKLDEQKTKMLEDARNDD